MTIRYRLAGAALLLATAVASAAASAETLRVGKAVPEAFSFVPLDVGMRTGIFKKNGLDIEESGFGGSAKLQQALAADGIDMGLGSGPEMAFIAKGAPVKGVAAMAGPPLLLVIIVRKDSPIKTVDDLKGKRVSVSTVGSLTAWLVGELSRQKGWGPNGINVAPLGDSKPQVVALHSGEIDGMVTDLSTALADEKAGGSRILLKFGDLVKDFHIHVIYASNKLIAAKPETIRAFLKGWLETIAFMRANKAKTVEISKDVMAVDADVAARTYDELMPMFSDDGHFDPKALATLSRSYVDLKILPEQPDMSKLYTEAFLPKK
jgi:NitT/TauT family transport system substrate-binding protein